MSLVHLRALTALALAVLLAFFVWVGSLGLDFGTQWDARYFFEGLDNSVSALALRPGSYTYGGNYFNVGYVALLPTLRMHLPNALRSMSKLPTRPMENERYPLLGEMQTALKAEIASDAFMLRARRMFMIVTSLGILWTFLLAYAISAKVRAALAAAALYAFSWEVGYHSRFIAVDGMLCQLAALTFALLVFALGAQTIRRAVWSYLGAGIAVGLAIGCKLTGVFLLLPLVAVPFLPSKFRALFGRLDRAGLTFVALLLAALALIVTTPGVIEDPLRFAMSVFFERFGYNKDTIAYTYAVDGLLEHAALVFVYFSTAVASHAAPVSIAVAVFAIAGFVWVWRTRRDVAILLLVFAIPYLGFVCSNILMIVRNYLQLTPLFFSLAAIGWCALFSAPARWARAAKIAAIACAVATVSYNAYWGVSAARSITGATRASIEADAWSYLSSRGGPSLVSPRLQESFKGKLDCKPVPSELSNSTDVLLFFGEHDANTWKANRRFYYRRVFSSMEMNWEYGPSFPGRHDTNRIFALSRRKARSLGMKLAEFSLCTPR